MLVTIAENLPHEPQLKVWALDKVEKKTGIPKCLSSIKIQNGRRPFPVRCNGESAEDYTNAV